MNMRIIRSLSVVYIMIREMVRMSYNYLYFFLPHPEYLHVVRNYNESLKI